MYAEVDQLDRIICAFDDFDSTLLEQKGDRIQRVQNVAE